MMAGVSYTVEKIKGKGRRFLLLKDRIERLIETGELLLLKDRIECLILEIL